MPFGAGNAPLCIDPFFKQVLDGLPDPEDGRLFSTDDQVADVGVGDDIADDLFDFSPEASSRVRRPKACIARMRSDFSFRGGSSTLVCVGSSMVSLLYSFVPGISVLCLYTIVNLKGYRWHYN